MIRSSRTINSLLMIIFSLVFIVVIGFLSIMQYNYVAEDQTASFYREISDRSANLNHTVSILFEGLKLYDSRYDYEMEIVLSAISDSYVRSGSDIHSLNLTAWKEKYSPFFKGTLDLYILNSSNIVEMTTYLPDLGLDFRQFPRFASNLDKIREGDRFQADQWVDSVNTPGYYRKYAYMPTPDHRYILEIGLHSDEFSKMRKDVFSYNILGSKIKENNPNLLAITFFNKNLDIIDERKNESGNQYLVNRFIPAEELNTTIKQVFSSKKSHLQEQNPYIIDYQYFSVREDLTPSSTEMHLVAVMVYSRQKIDSSLREYLIIHLVITGFAVILSLIFAMYISRFISLPLEIIIADIEQIARGDYHHQIRKTGGNDIDRLGTSVEMMVGKILEDIENIQEANLDIATELDRRKTAEQALIIANNKLNKLSTITRHDILNQVTSIRAYAYLAGQTDDHEDISRYMERIQRQSRVIEDMIAFSRDYHTLGINESSWQNLKKVIHDAVMVPFGDKITLTEEGTDVEILADPLLIKVFFNLADNSLSHGGPGGERIHVSFSSEDDTGKIAFRDEGSGVPADEKEIIFTQGYGTKTGLGLFLIREILAISGISIMETGNLGEGVCFEIIIPAEQFRKSS